MGRREVHRTKVRNQLPRNFRNIDRDERVERLVRIATDQFLTVGYARTTMSGIARSAGLTSAAVYWYFESKDAALAEVQRRVLESTREQLRSEGAQSPMTRLERYLEILRADARPLHRIMHERASHSALVATALEDHHREMEDMIRAAIQELDAAYPDMPRLVDLSMAVIEGTSAVGADVHSSDLIRWVVENMVRAKPGRRATAAH